MSEYSREEIIRHVESYGSLDLSSKDLRGIDLSGLDLSSIFFRRSDLRGANLLSATLDSADFTDARLEGARVGLQTLLTKAHHSGASFDNNNYAGAILPGVKIMGASFCGCDFSSAQLRGCNIHGTFHNASFVKAHFERATLSGDFSSSTMKLAKLHRAILGGQFADVDLSGADLSMSNVSSAGFRGANLSGVNMCGAILFGTKTGLDRHDSKREYGSYLREVNLTGANLKDAVLGRAGLVGAHPPHSGRNVNLCGANLAGACLVGAEVCGALYDETTIWPEGFSPELAGALLIETMPWYKQYLEREAKEEKRKVSFAASVVKKEQRKRNIRHNAQIKEYSVKICRILAPLCIVIGIMLTVLYGGYGLYLLAGLGAAAVLMIMLGIISNLPTE